MRIDSKEYSGLCSCGRNHPMQTRLCVIETGCLRSTDRLLEQEGLLGFRVAVYDENTYRATEGKHPEADREVILPAEGLHANEHGVALLLERLPEETEILLAVGAGTVHDICRYCAWQRKLRLVSCPTAASVDGFCSSVAAMTWNGCKKTVTAVAPEIVLADLEVIRNAPVRLARSGFGDMVGKYVSLADWRIGSILMGEYYCQRIADMTRKAAENVLLSAEGILSGDAGAYEKLMFGLLLSGLAMQMMGNSRPASGAEHHISHFIEMEPQAYSLHSNALHGEKVGVGTLLAIREYRRLAGLPGPLRDYGPFPPEDIEAVFGPERAADILAENEKDAAAGMTREVLEAKWEELRRVLAGLPEPESLAELYSRLGVKAALDEIGVPLEAEKVLLKHAPMVRNRLTLMRLRKCFDTEQPE